MAIDIHSVLTTRLSLGVVSKLNLNA